MSIESFRRRHLAWLAPDRLAERPWLVLGSAPEPALPSPTPADMARADIKLAGLSAKAAGLPPGDLTLLHERVKPEDIEALSLDRILELSDKPLSILASRLRTLLPGPPPRRIRVSPQEREAVNSFVIGDAFREAGPLKKPSNGIFIIAYAILMRVPQVVIAGISLGKDGHAYNSLNRFRKHKEEDGAALAEIARRYPHVSTSEPDLHAATGLPLWRPPVRP